MKVCEVSGTDDGDLRYDLVREVSGIGGGAGCHFGFCRLRRPGESSDGAAPRVVERPPQVGLLGRWRRLQRPDQGRGSG